MSRGFFSATTECLETFISSEVESSRRERERVRERARGRRALEFVGRERNFASAETAGVRSRLYRGLARGVVSRAERESEVSSGAPLNKSELLLLLLLCIARRWDARTVKFCHAIRQRRSPGRNICRIYIYANPEVCTANF